MYPFFRRVEFGEEFARMFIQTGNLAGGKGLKIPQPQPAKALAITVFSKYPKRRLPGILNKLYKLLPRDSIIIIRIIGFESI